MRAAVQRENEPATRGEFTDITRQNRASGLARAGYEIPSRGVSTAAHCLPLACSSWSTCASSVLICSLLNVRQAATCPGVRGKPRHAQVFDPKPDIKSIAGLFPRRRRYSGPTIATQFHEPFSRKLTQRTAHDRAASAETFADGVFRKFRARLQRLLDDRVAQSAIDRTPLGPRRVLPSTWPWLRAFVRDAPLRVSAAYDNVRPICVG